MECKSFSLFFSAAEGGAPAPVSSHALTRCPLEPQLLFVSWQIQKLGCSGSRGRLGSPQIFANNLSLISFVWLSS